MLASEKIVGFVPITDAGRAKAFYAEKLGLKCVSEDSFAVVFDANGIMLRLTMVQELKPQPFTILGWQVSDIVATVNGCKRLGSSLSATAVSCSKMSSVSGLLRATHAWLGSRTRTATR